MRTLIVEVSGARRARTDPPEGDHRARLVVRRGQQPRRLRTLGIHRDDRPARRSRHASPTRSRRCTATRRSSATPTGSTSSWQAMARKATKQPGRRRSTRSSTTTSGRTSLPPTRTSSSTPPSRRSARFATRATSASTRSSSGAGSTRPPTRSASRHDLVTDAPPIYIQEKIDPRVLIENLRRTAERPEDEPELTLFDPSTAWTASTRSTSTSTTPTGRTG